MGKLSVANENHNTINIIWNVQGWEIDVFIGIGETNSPDWICMVAIQITYIPCGLAFLSVF